VQASSWTFENPILKSFLDWFQCYFSRTYTLYAKESGFHFIQKYAANRHGKNYPTSRV
jgi:NAD-specific glutamate dehydrogenase